MYQYFIFIVWDYPSFIINGGKHSLASRTSVYVKQNSIVLSIFLLDDMLTGKCKHFGN